MSNDDDREVLEAADKEFGQAALVTGTFEDRPFWAYISIKPSKLDDFIAVQQSGQPYRLTDYGEVLEHKLGEKRPSDDVKAAIENKYGIDHQFEDKVKVVAETILKSAQTGGVPTPD